jgi:hypothetical protein
MAEKGAGMKRFTRGFWPGRVHEVSAAHTGGKREPARQGLAQANQVWHDAGVLAGEPAARPSEASVNLVQHQERIGIVAKPAEHRQKSGRGNIDTAPTLNRFHQYGPDPFVAQQPADRLFDPFQVAGAPWKRNEVPDASQLIEPGPAKVIAIRGVEGSISKAVICARKGDNAGPSGGQHRGFQRRLHCLETGVTKIVFAASESF